MAHSIARQKRVRHLRPVLPIDAKAVARRKEQNLAAPRPDARGLVPSIRSFAQVLDRQRQALEPVPLLSLSHPGCESIARALAARAASLALSGDATTLATQAPRRVTLLAMAGDPVPLRGKVDAILDSAIASSPDPASAFRAALALLAEEA